jgi:hypothetical protein
LPHLQLQRLQVVPPQVLCQLLPHLQLQRLQVVPPQVLPSEVLCGRVVMVLRPLTQLRAHLWRQLYSQKTTSKVGRSCRPPDMLTSPSSSAGTRGVRRS